MIDVEKPPAELLARAGAWPFDEARRVVKRLERLGKSEALFATGYGPSGLPHIGTFGEVARTSMVRHAFEALTRGAVPTRLVAFSDDMDGLRKVPDNVPNRDELAKHIGQPLTRVPDPFGTHDSFGAHNNARLRAFLDRFGFDYEFVSSTERYRAGAFDAMLLRVLERYDQVMAIMLPSLREERRATYSPVLPLHPVTGAVMQVAMSAVSAADGTVTWADEGGRTYTTPVTGGAAKLQWKPDWAMRWAALGVDYEMSGKDLIDSVRLSGAIARALGAEPPEGFTYELFLDEAGAKISKSKGNGLTIEEWLRYAEPASLSWFMFGKPREAKRLHLGVIPRAVDELDAGLDAYPRQEWPHRLGNPAWHVHAGAPPAPEAVAGGRISFALLLNLAAVANAEDEDVLWAFLNRYAPDASPATHPRLAAMVRGAVRYFQDHVKPAKRYRAPDDVERGALEALSDALSRLPPGATPEEAQAEVYNVGRAVPRYQDMNAKGATPERPGVSQAWFEALYQVLLGEPKGPRFGSFAALYGVANTRALIGKALAGELIAEHAAFLEGRAA